MPPLTTSLRWTTPSARSPSATTSGVPPKREMRSVISISCGGNLPPCSLDEFGDGVGGALADAAAVDIDAAHAGLRGEGDEVRLVLGDFAAADVVLLLGEHDDGAAFGGFVGEAGKLRGVGQLLLADAVHGDELDGLAIAERDGAGLVEQQAC